jgi:hypothetical protein
MPGQAQPGFSHLAIALSQQLLVGSGVGAGVGGEDGFAELGGGSGAEAGGREARAVVPSADAMTVVADAINVAMAVGAPLGTGTTIGGSGGRTSFATP